MSTTLKHIDRFARQLAEALKWGGPSSSFTLPIPLSLAKKSGVEPDPSETRLYLKQELDKTT